MAFSSFPYFLTYSQNTAMGITANDSMSGSQLSLRQIQGNFLSLFNIDFENGVFGLATSGNQLVLDISELASGKPLVLKPYNSASMTQRWDFYTRPGFILNRQNPNLVIDNKDRGGNGSLIWLYEFNASPAQQWAFKPLTSAQRSELLFAEQA
ncbi:hypothetical protein C2134_02560 [Chromobacterium sinusclupearum]|uniref:Ricin B lectin domain-containing protein n=1 Tax=Chromobacterium sinusclupearum TaxID=2077146 RepID=A0A2K4MTK0_9NEIS|nr:MULTISPECIES: RICIN domain-containing protein [Chromobacterium]POB00300.1 hypothetical protein C2134_02560 [Chromobacterium sinusclupearum]